MNTKLEDMIYNQLSRQCDSSFVLTASVDKEGGRHYRLLSTKAVDYLVDGEGDIKEVLDSLLGADDVRVHDLGECSEAVEAMVSVLYDEGACGNFVGFMRKVLTGSMAVWDKDDVTHYAIVMPD